MVVYISVLVLGGGSGWRFGIKDYFSNLGVGWLVSLVYLVSFIMVRDFVLKIKIDGV